LKQEIVLEKAAKNFNLKQLLSFDVYDRFLRLQAMINDDRITGTDELISTILSQTLHSLKLQFYATHNKAITKKGDDNWLKLP
jgi:hypothetical protein